MKSKQYCENIKNACKSNLSIPDIQNIYKTCSKKNVITLTENLGKNKIVCSVVMPFFRAGKIAWLPFESLCRQIKVDFPWELIIIEESFDSPFGLENIISYLRRLEYVKCARVTYISLSKWLPLSAKWYYLIQETDPFSQTVLFNAADGYCSPHRIKKQHHVLSSGRYNWYKLATNVVYDIRSRVHVKRLLSDKSRNDTASRACSKELAKTLPLAGVRKSVDGWMYNTFEYLNKMDVYFDEDDLNMGNQTINVNGINNISINRHCRIKQTNPTPPLYKCCTNIENHVPHEIAKRLFSCKDEVDKHVQLRQKSRVNIFKA